jgi:hypothetical protein
MPGEVDAISSQTYKCSKYILLSAALFEMCFSNILQWTELILGKRQSFVQTSRGTPSEEPVHRWDDNNIITYFK